MADIDPIDVAELGRLTEQLATSFDVNVPTVMGRFSSDPSMLTPSSSGSPVRLSPVSTFVLGGKDDRSSFGYVVSSIGSHWGVIVGEPEEAFLYHLVFQHRRDIPSDAKPDSLTGKVRGVMLDATLWRDSMTKSTSTYEVGKTHYSPAELVRIGTTPHDPSPNQRQKHD